jgi:hypothetical protein
MAQKLKTYKKYLSKAKNMKKCMENDCCVTRRGATAF